MTLRGTVPRLRSRGIAVAGASVALVVVTMVMLVVRDRLDKAHVALVYLLVVLGGSAASGRAAGLSLAGAAFLLFNWFFLKPYNTLVIADPLDWLVLFAFLVTSGVAAELLHRQRRQAALAETRAEELDEIATLGAETLNAPRAEQALAAIATVIGRTVGAERCQLFVCEPDGSALHAVADKGGPLGPAAATSEASGLLSYIVNSRQSAVERDDGTIHVADAVGNGDTVTGPARAFAAPLAIRGVTVGAVRVSHGDGFGLSAEQRRLLGALSYYAALGLDRLRLEGAEETAESLRRADQLKDSLLAAVSHDLRTPLTTIKAIAHEIAGAGQPRAAVIEEEADRMSALVEGLLELSQLDAGARPVVPEINTIDDLVGAALQRAESVLRGHTVNVTFADEMLLSAEFDFAQTLRVLTNVLENAAKYSPVGAAIDLRVQRRGDAIEIAVSDLGAGIPVTERERVFEPFYRIPGTASDVRGAGLGLSIARRLARAQGGELTVDAAPAGGATFTLRLPVRDSRTG